MNMNHLVHTDREPVRNAYWSDLASYRWMSTLSNHAWAWEFLRRDPGYRYAYNDAVAEIAAGDALPDSTALRFGLLRFGDPDQDALVANVFWRMRACREVLPLATSPMDSGTAAGTLHLENLQCRTTVCNFGADQRKDVLFAQDGRFLQLAVFGDTPLAEALLLTPALPAPGYADSRLLAVRRLTDLVKHGWMRPALYPRQPRAERLMRVVQALDGWQAEVSHRDIGIALYGDARIERDWMHPGDNLRDQVRRAIRYGRDLMADGYKRFLN
jgi:hypothetical protein